LHARGSTLPRPRARARINSRCPPRGLPYSPSILFRGRNESLSPQRFFCSLPPPPPPAFPAAHFISRRVRRTTIKLAFPAARRAVPRSTSNIYSPRRLRKRKESRLRICYRDKPTITADFDWQMDARTRVRRFPEGNTWVSRAISTGRRHLWQQMLLVTWRRSHARRWR
jgi:hypothetical protein